MTEWSMQNINSDADPADELFLNGNCAKYLIRIGRVLWTECSGVLFCQCHFICTTLVILDGIFCYLGR